ncbi:MAG TPA: cysteine--tRNA ligase [Gammaproteobacteria bacterium]|nr:cysteine--tRNA ligase [Gammaproteobacteria bacterium]
MVTIYNTLTQRKEPLRPLESGKVRLYVCGMTVYDFCHLGHARMLLAFDVVVRYLRFSGYDVTYVRNITDVDDKILARAVEDKEPFTAITDRFIGAMHEDEAALSIVRPDQEPRATAHIDQMVNMIKKLLDSDHAYRADNGDVYFSVSNFPDYGKLSKKKPDELLEGARVKVGELKRDPRDFVLWKNAGDETVGWDSPWGYGRPGWHIECSAMSTCALGDTFDIHGGGSDLMFPHHENEIAQSEAATGSTFAKVWMHNGPLRIDDEKMSKSLGNFLTVREVLASYKPEIVRYLLVSSHYRSPINYSDNSLGQSVKAVERFYHCLKDLNLADSKTLTNSRFEKAFRRAMDDDFNTPQALSVLFEIVSEIHQVKGEDQALANQLGALLVRLGGSLGLLQADPAVFLQYAVGADIDKGEIDRLVNERVAARADENWQRADEIREQLSDLNVVIEDGAEGSTWRIKG